MNYDSVVVDLWCSLSFKNELSKDELKLRNDCAKILLKIIGDLK